MKSEYESVSHPDDWYTRSEFNRDGARVPKGFAPCARKKVNQFRRWRTEMNSRTSEYWKYEKQAAAEVVKKVDGMANISSGESAGFIRRISRNVVQHTPNVFIKNKFDDDSPEGILARHVLKTKIIGDDEYSNDMQQNLVTSARRGLTIGYDAVVPMLEQDSMGKWRVQYDTIHYRDVFPEPGAKDIRRAKETYVRRWLTKGQIYAIIKDQVPGWDIAALKTILTHSPTRSRESNDHESKKHSWNPDAYEIITWYNTYGEDFLTWEERTSMLIRIEENRDPLKRSPVMFFIPERDDQQPFGKSILSLTYGRQEFQDLFMNGSMKMFYRNINPPIIGYGTVNALPNFSPGKYTEISNPNAKIEALEINTQALMMFGNISQQNSGAMVQLIGAADQQMAMQSSGGTMSQTPQGVEAQQQMVDITTNNYQKAMENFFSYYCSYALTIYFQELKGTGAITVDADVRQQLIDAGVPAEAFLHEEQKTPIYDEEGMLVDVLTTPADDTGLPDGAFEVNWNDMAIVYYVQCVPGSLVELEDEKQLRILQQILVPISQAMPAMAASQDTEGLAKTSAAIQYIVQKTIELSGSAHASELSKIFTGETSQGQLTEQRIQALEEQLNGDIFEENEAQFSALDSIRAKLAAIEEAIAAAAEARQAAQGGQTGGFAAPAPVSPMQPTPALAS